MTVIAFRACLLLLPPLLTGSVFYFCGRKSRDKILCSAGLYIVIFLLLAGLYGLCCMSARASGWELVCGLYGPFCRPDQVEGITLSVFAETTGILTLLYVPVSLGCFGCFMFRSPEMKIFSAVCLVLYNTAWGTVTFLGSLE